MVRMNFNVFSSYLNFLLALHDLDPTFSSFCRSNLMKKIIREIIKIENPLLVQSMYIYKQPRIGGEG